jgi:hypothetical protein
MAIRSIGPSTWVGTPGSATVRTTVEVNGTHGELGTYATDDAEILYSPWKVETVNLDSGANTINLPVAASNRKASYCIIQPPLNNTVALTVKGVTGDTGVSINRVGHTALSFDNMWPPDSFCLTAGSAVVGVRLWWA